MNRLRVPLAGGTHVEPLSPSPMPGWERYATLPNELRWRSHQNTTSRSLGVVGLLIRGCKTSSMAATNSAGHRWNAPLSVPLPGLQLVFLSMAGAPSPARWTGLNCPTPLGLSPAKRRSVQRPRPSRRGTACHRDHMGFLLPTELPSSVPVSAVPSGHAPVPDFNKAACESCPP